MKDYSGLYQYERGLCWDYPDCRGVSGGFHKGGGPI